MSIVEVQRHYNLTPILKEAIEISEFNFKRSWKMRNGACISDNIVTFGFGRQCGHTTTIRELILDSPREFWENVFVVTPNYETAKTEYIKYGIDNAIPVQPQVRGSHNSLVGKRGYGIIFDSCNQTDIANFFRELAPYLRGRDDLKFVVNVSPNM